MIVTRFLYRSHNVTQCLSVTGAHVSGHWSPLVTTHLYPEVIIFFKNISVDDEQLEANIRREF